MPIDTFTQRDTDMVLTIRDGTPYLKTPQHEYGSPVPEDFVILMGCASSFLDPQFRKLMKAVVRQRHENGDLDGLLHTGNGRSS